MREKLTDADRVYPGDGVAPIPKLLKDLRDGGFSVMLSLELFNRKLWSQDPRSSPKPGSRSSKRSWMRWGRKRYDGFKGCHAGVADCEFASSDFNNTPFFENNTGDFMKKSPVI